MAASAWAARHLGAGARWRTVATETADLFRVNQVGWRSICRLTCGFSPSGSTVMWPCGSRMAGSLAGRSGRSS